MFPLAARITTGSLAVVEATKIVVVSDTPLEHVTVNGSTAKLTDPRTVHAEVSTDRIEIRAYAVDGRRTKYEGEITERIELEFAPAEAAPEPKPKPVFRQPVKTGPESIIKRPVY